jgi:hypothetical protein
MAERIERGGFRFPLPGISWRPADARTLLVRAGKRERRGTGACDGGEPRLQQGGQGRRKSVEARKTGRPFSALGRPSPHPAPRTPPPPSAAAAAAPFLLGLLARTLMNVPNVKASAVAMSVSTL